MVTVLYVIAWVILSRYLYWAWMRSDVMAERADTACEHGWVEEHRTLPCHPRTTRNKFMLACVAILAGSFVPFTLAFIAVMVSRPKRHKTTED